MNVNKVLARIERRKKKNTILYNNIEHAHNQSEREWVWCSVPSAVSMWIVERLEQAPSYRCCCRLFFLLRWSRRYTRCAIVWCCVISTGKTMSNERRSSLMRSDDTNPTWRRFVKTRCETFQCSWERMINTRKNNDKNSSVWVWLEMKQRSNNNKRWSRFDARSRIRSNC